MINIFKAGLFSLMLFIFVSCSSAGDEILPLEILESGVGITDISFTEILLEKSVLLFNPNRGSLEISGYDAQLALDDTEIIKESRQEILTVGPGESVLLTIPCRLNYGDIYQKIPVPDNMNERGYKIDTALRYTLPEGGEGSLELKCEGLLPLIREPLYDFDSLYVNSLGMMGADIIVRMAVINLNAFDILLKEFQGNLVVNGQNWSALKIPESLLVPAEGVSETLFRFRLEFLSMGKTVRDLLSGESELFFHFTGESVLSTDYEFLERELLPLDLDGEIGLYKPDDTSEGPHSSVKIEESIEENLLKIFGSYSR